MSLIHYSAKPFVLDRTRTYLPPKSEFWAKPRGLWVSVRGKDDWERWCLSENFALERLANRARIRLRPQPNLLHLRTVAQLDQFHSRFSRPPILPGLHTPVIDWPQVAARWNGIIIAPYQWSRRLHPDFMWYYGWDCASGCIWNLNSIRSIEVLPCPTEILSATSAASPVTV